VLCASSFATAFVVPFASARKPLHGNDARGAMQSSGARLRVSAPGKTAEKPEDVDLMLREDIDSRKDNKHVSLALPGMATAIPAKSPGRGLWRRWELMMRSISVFWTAGRLFLDYKILNWRTNQMTEDQAELSDELWEAAHSRNAQFLYTQFVALEGLWVKLGQFLSSRADVMPAKYIEVLSKCQDSLPARPFAAVKAQVEEELGKPLSELFASFCEEPVACASIAQVHKAVLLNGQKVVVKVQHDTVGKRLLQVYGDVGIYANMHIDTYTGIYR
jgi:hypothetical protein